MQVASLVLFFAAANKFRGRKLSSLNKISRDLDFCSLYLDLFRFSQFGNSSRSFVLLLYSFPRECQLTSWESQETEVNNLHILKESQVAFLSSSLFSYVPLYSFPAAKPLEPAHSLFIYPCRRAIKSEMASTVRACCSSAEMAAGASPFWGP